MIKKVIQPCHFLVSYKNSAIIPDIIFAFINRNIEHIYSIWQYCICDFSMVARKATRSGKNEKK
ncbi:MAG: hypothetical protein J6V20_03025 [Bacteroidaceae bacterium]|nr:hypothetical protein [Bacteroidaceae bacterium]